MDLDEIADELYAIRPDEFASVRDEHIKKARAEGQQPLARELAKLRKPTQSAWLINLLWRDQRDVMEQLFELADEMSRAQAEASGAVLRTLTAQRRQIEAALIGRARALASQAGVSVSAAMEREAQDTLSAALANPDVAEEVRTGRLVKPATYAGFGTPVGEPLQVRPPRAAAPAPARREEREREREPAEAEPEPLDLRAAQRARERREAAERQREEAARQVAEARAAVDAAAKVLQEREQAADEAQQQHASLAARAQQLLGEVRDLQTRLRETQAKHREVEDEAATAEEAAITASRRRDDAQRAYDMAQRTLSRAEQDLEGAESAAKS